MALTELNDISIAEICVYTPVLIVGIVLCLRHGFTRSSGWRYLILFALIRITGSAMQLATINDPTNMQLLQGAATLQSIGPSALILIMFGLLSRLLESIRQSQPTLITPRSLQVVQLVMMGALILGIIGGTKTATAVQVAARQGRTDYDVPIESRVAMGLMIIGFAIATIGTVLTGTQINAAEPGEKRLGLANALAFPFVLVRLVFSALGVFTSNGDFRMFFGSPNYLNYLLGMAIVTEIVAVVIFGAVGLTLQKQAVSRTGNKIPTGSHVDAKEAVSGRDYEMQ